MILLTKPHRRLSVSAARRAVSTVPSRLWARGNRASDRGPGAVAASLERGLRSLRLPFEIDPRQLKGADVVGVLSDLDALAAALAWRRRSPSRRLMAGPNLVVLPSDAPRVMEADELDLCLVPSPWVKRLYEEDAASLRGRISVWPAGVDVDYWKPGTSASPARREALIYRKDLPGQPNAGTDEIQLAEQCLRRAGFDVTSLVYGTFTRAHYRDALQRADLMVFYSPTESQCLAQVEAWAVDVPTLVWARGQFRYHGRDYESSSAPFLTPQTGREFKDADALANLLDGWDEIAAAVSPRTWVLAHMTDAISAGAYWALAHPSTD